MSCTVISPGFIESAGQETGSSGVCLVWSGAAVPATFPGAPEPASGALDIVGTMVIVGASAIMLPAEPVPLFAVLLEACIGCIAAAAAGVAEV